MIAVAKKNTDNGRSLKPNTGSKIVNGKDESISLPVSAFVLKDARVPEGGIAFPTGTLDDKIGHLNKQFLILQKI